MVTVEDVRAFASRLPRTTEVIVRDRIKFRVGRIVYVAFSRDETVMGFGFPRDEREALVASEPAKFQLPPPSDMRYQWVEARMDALDDTEMRELVLDAWRMCVPKKVSARVGRDGAPIPSTAWRRFRATVDLDEYDTRWDRMAAAGEGVHGEADFVESLHPATVLDAGCGTGRVAIELAKRGIEVVGVDADPDMLERAARRAPPLAWVLADLAALDLARTFDVVVMASRRLSPSVMRAWRTTARAASAA